MANYFPLVVLSSNGNGVIEELPALDNLNLANSGIVNLQVANLQLLGGANGQVLSTDGNGNLSWTTGGSGGNGVPGGSNTQLQFNNAGAFGGVPNVTWNGSNLSLGSNSNVKLQGGTTGQFLQTDGTGNLAWANSVVGPAGANTEIQFNDSGAFGSNAQFTYNKVSNTLSTVNLNVPGVSNLGDATTVFITGGTNGQFLQTDGLGNLAWATATFTPGGSNTSVQFNTNGNLDGTSTFTYDSGTDTVIANNLSLNGTAILGSNNEVFISGGNVGEVLTTDGFGNLSWTTVSGGNGGGGGAIIFSSAAWQAGNSVAGDAYWWNGSETVNEKPVVASFVAAFTPDSISNITINGVAVSNVANITLPGSSSGNFTIPAVSIPNSVQTASGSLQMIVSMSNSVSNTSQLGSTALTPILTQPIDFAVTGTITATPTNPASQPFWLPASTGNVTAAGVSLNTGSTLSNVVLTLLSGATPIANATSGSLSPYTFSNVAVGNYTVTASISGAGSHGANPNVTLPLQTSGVATISQPVYQPLFTKINANSTVPTFTTSDTYQPYDFVSGDSFTFTVDTQTGNYFWTAVPGTTSRVFLYNTGIGNAIVTPDSATSTTISGASYQVYGFTNVAIGTVFTID